MPRFFEQSSAVLYKTCLSQDRSASATWFIHWIQDLTWSNYHFFLPTKRSTQISNGMHPRAMTLSYQPGSLWTCQDYLPRSILVNKHVLVYFVSLRTEALFLVVLFLWAFRKRLSFWDQGPAALTRLVAGLSDRRRDACCTREKQMEFTDGFGSSGNFPVFSHFFQHVLLWTLSLWVLALEVQYSEYSGGRALSVLLLDKL